MEVIYAGENIPTGGSVAALGNFDGLHTAHMAIIRKAIGFARERGLKSGVMLFEEITRNLTHVIYTHILLKYMYRIPFIDAVIWISMAYALGVVITWGLKKIPYFARLI